MQSILLFLYLTILPLAPDSIGAKVVEGRKIIIHRVEPKETWYSLSRKYGVPVPVLQSNNPNIPSLVIGQNIEVPAKKQLIRTSTVLSNLPSLKQQSTAIARPTPAPVPVATPTFVAQKTQPSLAEGKTHTVNAGETMFSIAKRYGVSVANIKDWNNLGNDNTVRIGQTLSVSGPSASYDVNTNTARTTTQSAPLQNRPLTVADVERQKKMADKHIVSSDPWERIEHLADEVHEGRPAVRDTNRRKAGGPAVINPANKGVVAGSGTQNTGSGTQTTLPIGKPIVPVAKPVVTVPSVKRDSSRMFHDKGEVVAASTPASVLMKTKKDSLSSGTRALKETTERGAAAWINDEQVNPTKFYALHRTAPIGTIIKVTNITNNQSVFVKVVGILPDTGDNSNLVIKISKAAAKKLNTLDAKFQAELSYGVSQ